jgi:EAL domain-containing protein (putative c-di-GMP-specific phosphodiesterase class I)
VKIAVDDAGSGYASMRHVLNIIPNFIKLDVSLTRNIDSDRMRRALASALIEFGQQADCRIVAEGVETTGEMETLRHLGVHKAQGYFLSHPLPLQEFLARL